MLKIDTVYLCYGFVTINFNPVMVVSLLRLTTIVVFSDHVFPTAIIVVPLRVNKIDGVLHDPTLLAHGSS